MTMQQRQTLGVAFALLCSALIGGTACAADLEIGMSKDVVVHDEAEGIASPRIISSTAGKGGGFQLAFSVNGFNTGYLKITPDIHSGWVKLGPPVNGFAFIVEASDGGYWGVGFGSVIRMDQGGKTLWERPLPEADEHMAYCGVQVGDGFALVGASDAWYQDKNGHKMHFSVPWIAMVDKEGKLLWQKAIPEYDKAVLYAGYQTTCSDLVAASNGTITWALGLEQSRLEHQDGKDYVPTDDHGSVDGERARLLVQLGPQGNEIRETLQKTPDSQSEFLFSTNDGFLLAEHHRHYLDPNASKKTPVIVTLAEGKVARATAGVDVTMLREDLTVLKTKTFRIPELEDRLSAVMPDSEGGLFLAGCTLWGNISVVHINKNEQVDAKKTVSTNQCSELTFAHDGSDKGLLLLVAEHDKIFPIKYVP